MRALCAKKNRCSRPVSRILYSRSPSQAAASDDHSSTPVIAHGLQRPTRWLERAVRPARNACASRTYATLFGLAPCGVWPATRVATGAVRSYRTFSPLPCAPGWTQGPGDTRCTWTEWRRPFHQRRHSTPARHARRYFFCATFRQVTLPGRYPAHCPVEFGLSSPGRTSRREPRLHPTTVIRPTAANSIIALRN